MLYDQERMFPLRTLPLRPEQLKEVYQYSHISQLTNLSNIKGIIPTV
jgi:hypothetical protein